MHGATRCKHILNISYKPVSSDLKNLECRRSTTFRFPTNWPKEICQSESRRTKRSEINPPLDRRVISKRWQFSSYVFDLIFELRNRFTLYTQTNWVRAYKHIFLHSLCFHRDRNKLGGIYQTVSNRIRRFYLYHEQL